MTRTLIDPKLNARLERDGFVTVPGVIEPAMASRLRDQYGELHGWHGQGFEPDLQNPDCGYRKRVSALLAERLDEFVGGLFVDHEPFLRNFLCKWPGLDSELYLHQDWTYVDERVGQRSHVVWIALQDVTGHNGQLRVLRGSHRIDGMPRGTDLDAPWMSHQSVIRARLESVPVQAGDAVVFDNALVHCSYSNNTDLPRVVAAIGMRRSGTPLIYWRRVGPSGAERRDVTEEFFLTYTPTGLMQEPPAEPVSESCPIERLDLDAEGLAANLDDTVRTGMRPTVRLGRWISAHGPSSWQSTGR